MIPELTLQDQLKMTLSQISRYEKKRTKMRYNNRYYIQYYNYNVALHDWEIIHDPDNYIYFVGTLENGNPWQTSPMVSIKTEVDHYVVLTESNTTYRLYF